MRSIIQPIARGVLLLLCAIGSPCSFADPSDVERELVVQFKQSGTARYICEYVCSSVTGR
jgi:hypothetical protein